MRSAKDNIDELNDIIQQDIGSKETSIAYFSEWIDQKRTKRKARLQLNNGLSSLQTESRRRTRLHRIGR
ncbi:hypothetical protein PO124_19710 [Bacillus licheniformis]|nr:hypothetical protein [Bacillus licheniformis]